MIAAINSHRATAIKMLDDVSEDIETELFELERQVFSLPSGLRRDRLMQWHDLAKEEYLNARAITNILCNHFELDSLIPLGVVEHDGETSFDLPADEVTETLTQIQFLGELFKERDCSRSSRTAIRQQLFGILS